jgi:hypothetical protein
MVRSWLSFARLKSPQGELAGFLSSIFTLLGEDDMVLSIPLGRLMKQTKSTTPLASTAADAEARKLLEQACDLYESGERSRSIKLFLEAAAQGNCEAQVNLANIYDEGDDVKADFDKARYWYKRAIAGGSPQAAYNLGISYLNRGHARWARHWLHVAKSMGDEDAGEKLGELDAYAGKVF